MNIEAIKAYQIFDSRGNPTIQADVILEDGTTGSAAIPSGASVGASEAHELRDGGEAYGGLGVQKAIDGIHEVIGPELKGYDPHEQEAIDARMRVLDGTETKANLGANAILAVSLANARAAAAQVNWPLFRHVSVLAGNDEFYNDFGLPLALMNFMNGGKHADGSTDIQEYMIVPVGAETFAQQMRVGTEIFHELGKLLTEVGFATTVGDEGGYAPAVQNGNVQPLHLLVEAIKRAGYEPGEDVMLALDVAATELYSGEYVLKREDPLQEKTMTRDQMIEWYDELYDQFPLFSIEDGLAEDDWEGWQHLTAELGDGLQIVGDDLLVTNPARIAEAIGKRAANAVLVKPNQIGTLTETIDAVQMAQNAGWVTIMSHRSGETEDTTIADLAVGLGTDQIKAGSVTRSERVAKYNRLLRIEQELE